MQPFDPATTPYVSLATFRKNGAMVATPVWVAALDAHYYVFSEARAGKMKRLRNNPRIRLAACSYNGKLASDWLEGEAHRVSDPDLIRQVYTRFTAKYGWQFRLTNLLSRLAGRYDQRAMIEISLAPAEA